MKIYKRKIAVNGVKETLISLDNQKWYSETALPTMLREKFGRQGEFYAEVLGVNKELALSAAWHPMHDDFCVDCGGWEKMLEDRGKIFQCEEKVTECDLKPYFIKRVIPKFVKLVKKSKQQEKEAKNV